MNRQEMFQGKRWGLFNHYLCVPAGDGTGEPCSPEEWNARVDAFDVELLAAQLREVGADYFCITIGQNSGHYCSPNPVYDQLVGISPSKCSRRDLIADLGAALEPQGIDLWVYLPSGAPCADAQAVERLEWVDGQGQRLASFQRKWEAVIREWSLRWGERVKGWWIDGCYYPDAMYNFPDEPNFKSFAAAIRAGNPQAVVAFNRGLEDPFLPQCPWEDYTAGEVGDWLPIPGQKVREQLQGKKLHVLSYLGQTWGQGQPRFPDELVAGYTKLILAQDGILTWDIPLEPNGAIPQDYRRQLQALGRMLKE